jgi:cutinase
MSARNIAGVLGVAAAMTSMPLSTLIDAGPAAAGPCPDVEVVFARGSDEARGVGAVGQAFIDSLRSQAAGRSLGVYAVNYPATYNFARSMPVGVSDARTHVESAVANCPNTKMVLGGYSQGAAVIDMTTDALPSPVAGHVAAVALFGNMVSTYARSQGGGPVPAIGPLYQPKTIDLCMPDDPICSEGKNDDAHHQYVQSGMTNEAAAFAAGRL